ncbi:hypothetical protein JCM10212_004481 [Sporobolomyces blumeae]
MCPTPPTTATPPSGPAPAAKNSRTSSSRSSKSLPPEHRLVVPTHDALKAHQGPHVEIIDTHTHVWSTFNAYREKYPQGQHETVKDFVKATLCDDNSNRISKLVDVWCEAKDPAARPEFADVVDSLSALDQLEYRYVIGCHPHDAINYTQELEEAYLKAHSDRRCVGWGEMGLDYHYDNSPRDIQQDVLRRQLRAALRSGLDKAITIHTREADDDILTILTEELPRTARVHIHCFTDSPALATNLLDHFPNLYFGITGVVTFSSNANTSQVVRTLARRYRSRTDDQPRFLLETDAPFMTNANMGPNSKLGMTSKQKFPFCHPGLLPYTAEFVAKVINESDGQGGDEGSAAGDVEKDVWDTVRVLEVARENARTVYRI